jgi:hypothetical protein
VFDYHDPLVHGDRAAAIDACRSTRLHTGRDSPYAQISHPG